MKIEIYDSNMQGHTIGSKNARTIGDWFAEHAARIMSADSRELTQIRVWPDDEDDFRIVRQDGLRLKFTQVDLLYLAEKILEAAQQLADVEAGAGK